MATFVDIILPAPLDKRWRRLWTTDNDLDFCAEHTALMLRKRFHSGHVRTKGAYLQARVFNSSLVVAYVRAFLDPSDWENELFKLAKPSTTEIRLHREMKTMRNQLFAHTDQRRFKITPMRNLRWKHMRCEAVDADSFALTALQLQTLDGYIARLRTAVRREMNAITDAVR